MTNRESLTINQAQLFEDVSSTDSKNLYIVEKSSMNFKYCYLDARLNDKLVAEIDVPIFKVLVEVQPQL